LKSLLADSEEPRVGQITNQLEGMSLPQLDENLSDLPKNFISEEINVETPSLLPIKQEIEPPRITPSKRYHKRADPAAKTSKNLAQI